MRPSDEQLISQLQAGDKSALTELFSRYHRLVLSVANKIIHDPAEAEDTMQEVFLSIYRCVAQYDSRRANPKVWILQFAYYQSLSRRRQLTAKSFYVPAELEEGDRAPQNLLGWSSLSGAESKRLVREALDTLTRKERRTLELAYFEGLSMKEIADKTGDSFAAVRHQYYRALRKLHSLLFEPREKKVVVANPQEAIDAGA